MSTIASDSPARLRITPSLRLMAGAGVGLWLAACSGSSTTETGADAPPADPPPAKSVQAAAPADRSGWNLSLTPPAMLADDNINLKARAGDDLDKASKSFQAILAAITRPEYLNPSKPGAVRPASPGEEESPAAAVRAYALGRAAYLEGNRFEAVNQLEQAHKLDPNSAQVLRLLGSVYISRGDDVRGAQRLAEAVKLQPDDADSLLMLGRFAFQKHRWEEAVSVLAAAEAARKRGNADPAVEYLAPYYLGQSLLELGYDAAAVHSLEQYLTLPQTFTRTTRLHRELAFLDRQMGLVRVQVGDAGCRLGQFEQALRHYEQAFKDDDGLVDQNQLSARRIYALMVMRRSGEAERSIVNQLRQPNVAPGFLKLVPYVADNSDDRRQFVRLVSSVYEQSGRSPTLALAVAQVADPAQVPKLLTEHLKHKPNDLQVLSRLIDHLSRNDPQSLVGTVLGLIRAHPQLGSQYAGEMLKQSKLSPDELVKQIESAPETDKSSAAGWYLRGAIHEKAGRNEPAAEAYDKAFAIDKTFASPHLATIELQLRLQHYDKAIELLDKINRPEDADLKYARARALAGLNKIEQAQAVLDDLLNAQPRNVKYRLFQSRLQVLKRDFAAAERTLWSILDFETSNEDAYAALFDLYESDPRTDPTQWVRLMKRVQQEIPASRIARLKMAEYYAQNRLYDRAEQNLRSILTENPADDEALGKLVGVFGRADRWSDAEKLLIDTLDRRPDSSLAVVLLEEVSNKLGHAEQFMHRKEAFLKRLKPSLERAVEMARLYSQWKKPGEAVKALEEAIQFKPEIAGEIRSDMARLYQMDKQTDKALEQLDLAIKEQPAKAPDYLYEKASIYTIEDKLDKAEQMLTQALKLNGDHPPSNNDLAYFYADQNRHLERALMMAVKAVASDPENGAYLDTLGWVYYKLGRFEESVARLEEARTKPQGGDAVILDHLGDALWRMGKPEQSLSVWQGALRAAEQSKTKDRPEIQKVLKTLDEKIKAVHAAREPDLAPVVEKKNKE